MTSLEEIKEEYKQLLEYFQSLNEGQDFESALYSYHLNELANMIGHRTMMEEMNSGSQSK